MARILIPIPSLDFDPTEVAVPWRVLTSKGHDVVLATPDGKPGAADELMVTGKGLDLWGFVPLLRELVLVGRALRANPDARRAYAELLDAPAFRAPVRWDDARVDDFDAILFPGGHRARGMRAYLENATVQNLAVAFARATKPIGAICHGVLVLARANDPQTGRSILFGRKTTALTWRLEGSAASLARVFRFWDPHYYRTYREQAGQPDGYMSVQQEVTRALASPADFLDVPADAPFAQLKNSGLARDTVQDLRPSWVVRDGNYLSARWPGDAHAFALDFVQLIEGSRPGPT